LIDIFLIYTSFIDVVALCDDVIFLMYDFDYIFINANNLSFIL